MIKSFQLLGPTSFINWGNETEFLKDKRVIKFSDKKVNVIVGPNGCGKTTLVEYLRVFTFTKEFNISKATRKYLSERSYFDRPDDRNWGEKVFMPNVEIKTDFCKSFYYRPNYLPGDEHDLTHSLCMGYDIKDIREKVDKKSSGQKSNAILNDAYEFIDKAKDHCKVIPFTLGYANNKEIEQSYQWPGYEIRAIKSLLTKALPLSKPTIIFDEPEQSLDLKSHIEFWDKMANVNTEEVQVIIVTHSVIPFIKDTEKYNFIEVIPGYVKDIKKIM